MKSISLAYLICLTLVSPSIFSQTLSRYDSTGNPKAKGISLAVKYPSDWRVSDGDRPNIVQKFTKDYPDYSMVLMVQIMNLPDGAEKGASFFTTSDWRDILGSLGTASNVYETKLEFEKAFVGDISMRTERAGMAVNQKQRVISLIYRHKWIWLWCGVAGMPNLNAAQVNQIFGQNEQKCFSFFNSLVLNQRYAN